MSQDIGKGLDPKWETSGRQDVLRETRRTAGDKTYHGRRSMPWETRRAAGDEMYRGRRVMPRETGHAAGDGSEAEGISVMSLK